jgi:D-glycero-alpha-D-manno-heptose-7-phosphate kinase
MIISRTPYRISFFGGGTDYPTWYREHGGAVLATTIDKYCFIQARYLPPFFHHKYRVVYSKTELPNTIDEIEHPSVRECLRFLGMNRGVEIQHGGDLPARSGMGSSSAFTVGLLNALHALKESMPGQHRLAAEAIEVEQNRIGESVGSQDQVIAAYGGFRRIDFAPSGEFTATPMVLPTPRLAELQRHLMLVFTGVARTASTVAAEQIRTTGQRVAELTAMRQLVDEAVAVLNSGVDIAEVGRLLDEAWRIKRGLTGLITTNQVDDLYAAARDCGAIGGKLLGAGGGGFFLIFARPEDHPRIRGRLRDLVHVPFAFTSAGSQIIHYDGPPAEEVPLTIETAAETVAG